MDVSEAKAKIYKYIDKKSLKNYILIITGQVIKGAGRMPWH